MCCEVFLEIRRDGRFAAVPIFHSSIFGFQEPEEAAVGAVPELMAPRFDGVTGFDGVARDSDFFKSSAAGGFQSPNLRLATGVLHFEVDPGMRDHQVQFLDYALQINK